MCDNKPEQFAAADAWLRSLPHAHKLYVAGNHDTHTIGRPELLPSVTHLIDEAIEIPFREQAGSLRLYGLPWQFGDRVGAELMIPDGIDVLISHEPPYGVLDYAPSMQANIGNRDLLERVRAVKPKLHLFGHTHFRHGYERRGETLLVNAAICGEGDMQRSRYAVAHTPTVIEMGADGTGTIIAAVRDLSTGVVAIRTTRLVKVSN